MNVTVIPFFLSAFANLDQIENGPEYIFSGHNNVSAYIKKDNKNSFSNYYTITLLICQPRNQQSKNNFTNVLHCRVNDTKTEYTEKDSNGKILSTAHHDELAHETIRFDLVFDENGVHQMILPKSDHYINSGKKSIYKMLTNLLNIGTNLSAKKDWHFKEINSFGIDGCTVNYELEHKVQNKEEGEFKLESPYKKNGHALHLHKSIDVNSCPTFGSMYLEDEPSLWNNRLTNASSYILLTDKKFESSFSMKLKLSEELKKAEVDVSDKSFLKLENIVPAVEKLKPLTDFIKTTVLAIPIS